MAWMENLLTASREHNDIKLGFMYKMFNLKLHVPCIFLCERLKPRKTTMKIKIHLLYIFG